jgi:hypothetical protein
MNQILDAVVDSSKNCERRCAADESSCQSH